MRTRRTQSIVLASVLLLLIVTTPGSAQLPNLNELMRQKLEHAQHLLEAIVLERHTAIERYANELTLLSEASTWTPLRTPEYLNYAASFRDVAGSLQEAAQDRDLDGVSSGYMELVATCVRCHMHVRGAQQAD